jgi:hypothetical protein
VRRLVDTPIALKGFLCAHTKLPEPIFVEKVARQEKWYKVPPYNFEFPIDLSKKVLKRHYPLTQFPCEWLKRRFGKYESIVFFVLVWQKILR